MYPFTLHLFPYLCVLPRCSMSILDQIISQKRIEVQAAKAANRLEVLEESPYFSRTTISLKERLVRGGSPGIIAEFKRKSPSKGWIYPDADVRTVVSGYESSGAAGISVLTDSTFFGGSKEDLLAARAAAPNTPLLRKDFMIDPYQMHEAKAWGADVILLIAANLSPEQIDSLGKAAHALGLEVLLEVHDAEELKSSPLAHVDIIGVNNRNLKNFAENNVKASLDLVELLPKDKPKISESCISASETVKELYAVGFQGFLMGENFMKTAVPGETLSQFKSELL
jgi:indole-3-glycerol phosphate synthase